MTVALLVVLGLLFIFGTFRLHRQRRALPQPVTVPAPPPSPRVSAIVRSSDNVLDAPMDVTPWFDRAVPDDLITAVGDGPAAEAVARDVAYYMGAGDPGTEAKRVFDYIELFRDNVRHRVTIECSLNRSEGCAWIEVSRPEVWRKVLAFKQAAEEFSFDGQSPRTSAA